MFLIVIFMLPLALFILSFVLEATLSKVAEKAMDKTTSSLMAKINPNINTGKTVQNQQKLIRNTKFVLKLTKAAIHGAVSAIKLIIALIRGIVVVITALGSVTAIVALTIVIVMFSAISGVVLVANSRELDKSSSDKNIEVKNEISSSDVTATYNDWFWVGDSRTVGLAMVNGEEILENGNLVDTDKYLGKVGQGYAWFTGDGIKDSRDKLFESKSKNIVFNLGVNDLDNIDKYIAYYKNLPVDFVKNNNIILMTINPVTDALSSVKNSQIVEFNSKIESELGSVYTIVDTYTYFMEELDEDDNKEDLNEALTDSMGIHYTNDVYKKMQQFVKDTIGGS